MSAAKKRPRAAETDETRAECPFQIRLVDPKEKEQKQKKRRKAGSPDDDSAKKTLNQLSPFSPTGKFKTYETMDVHYSVDPAKKWSDMTRYNSFVLNGVKYFSEGFIYVANDSSIERQKAVANKEPLQPRKKSEDDWVARILEIRASDEHHVYARVYWMYWPDELPPHTVDGKKTVQGRQPYHGQMELIASNHMDIINVVSVTSQATVNQWFEENDDDVQSSLYWRQAFDVRTYELSSVDPVCRCGQPGNPDETLIGCTSKSCEKWLHIECLKHAVLLKTYERLGRDKPHRPPEPAPVEKEANEEAKRPLSPLETGAAVSAQQSIDVKADGEPASEKVVDNVEVKDVKDAKESETDRDAPASKEPAPKAELPERPRNTSIETTAAPKLGVATKRVPKPRRKSEFNSEKPYEGLFSAELLMDLTPPVMEIKDLRDGIEGGEKTWRERFHCLVCGAQID